MRAIMPGVSAILAGFVVALGVRLLFGGFNATQGFSGGGRAVGLTVTRRHRLGTGLTTTQTNPTDAHRVGSGITTTQANPIASHTVS